MFSVPRYNPESPAPKKQQQQRKSKGKKRKLPPPQQGDHGQPAATATTTLKSSSASSPPQQHHQNRRRLQVIAPDEEAQDRKKKGSSRAQMVLENEALDDLDLLLLDPDEAVEEAAATTTNQSPSKSRTASSQQQPANTAEVQAALHAASLPMKEVAKVWKLAPFLQDNLQRDGFDHFFPIQALVIPDVITSERHPYLRAQDVCLTAPTGSGKTLGYVLPILNALAHVRLRGRLRALVVLPGRDLAQQVYSVFTDYVLGSKLKVGLAIGQSDFKAEQKALTVGHDDVHDDGDAFGDPRRNMTLARQKLVFDPGNLGLARQANEISSVRSVANPSASHSEWDSSSSAVDVLVCTPGRLVDHLDNTPGFTLQHLRFLVVDEADRLLSQPYQNWIDRVIEDANSASVKAWRQMEKNESSNTPNNALPLQLSPDGTSYQIHPITWRRGGSGGDTSEFNTNTSYFNATAAVCRPVQLRKFLVSATLTKDPRKLATLKLVNPKHFDLHQIMSRGGFTSNKFSMAQGLSEYTIECKAEQKPIVLLALLLELLEKGDNGTVVVFTSSIDSTHRLARLLQLLWIRGNYGKANAVAEFSSALNQAERTALLSRCRDPADAVSVLVCSDGMSRGMDLDSVHAVINYDVPSLAKTYVHRCGRTARAGKTGVSISILKGGQVTQFRRMRDLIQEPEQVQGWSVKKSLVNDTGPVYRECLQALRKLLKEEDDGNVKPTIELEASVFEKDGPSEQESEEESDA